jgi:lysophospholipase L1-like esterase
MSNSCLLPLLVLANLVAFFGMPSQVQGAEEAGAKPFVLTSKNDPTKPVPGGVRWFGRQHHDYVQQTKNKRFDLCFLGDSITDGWPRDMFNKYYAKYNVVNFGIGGDRCENVLWRLQNGELIGTSPKVIVLMIGTNNSGMNTAPEIAHGITAVVKALRVGCPRTRILLMAVLPKRDMILEKTRAINSVIAKLDDGKMIRYLDISPVMLDENDQIKEDVLKDVVHLDRLGYGMWATLMDPLLAEMMK